VGLAFIVTFVQFMLLALWILVFGRMLMSWVDPTGRNQVSAFLFQATEPMLAPVRRMLPATGMFDWSTLVVLLALGLLLRMF
jgi:YggT family protein